MVAQIVPYDRRKSDEGMMKIVKSGTVTLPSLVAIPIDYCASQCTIPIMILDTLGYTPRLKNLRPTMEMQNNSSIREGGLSTGWWRH